MEQHKTVSVVVSTFRRDAMLARALESLAAQTSKDFDIVVVDDNANPEWNTRVETVIRAFRTRHPDIALSYLPNSDNLGSAEARNRGIRQAKGEYITFLDDDDLYLPEKIENQLEYMRRDGIDYCVADMALYYENEVLSEKRVRRGIEKMGQEELFRYHFMHHITGTDTMMFRRDYLEKIGGFPPIDVGDEFYLIHRAIDGGGKFGYLHSCDVKAYVHTGDGGLSSGQGKLDGENQLYQYKKQFFHRFDIRSIRFIRMRHYAVLAFAGLRKKAYGFFMINSLLCFLSAPLQCICFLRSRCGDSSEDGLQMDVQTLSKPVKQ